MPPSTKFFPWIPGLSLALAGVACVRLLAPHLTGRGQGALLLFGFLLVPAGLGLIARQIQQRATVHPRKDHQT